LLERNAAFRQLAEEVAQAEKYVRSLLPAPLTGSIEATWRFIPSTQLGGDLFGYHWLDPQHFVVYLLDVCGHGVGAALLSFTLNHMLSPSAEGALLVEDAGHGPIVVPPSRVAERLNRQFPMDRTRQYFTFVYGVFDEPQGQFRYVMAGHPAPVFLPRNGPPSPLPGGGLPIGMLDHATYTDETLHVRPGDRLYFYTDGVVEAMNASEQEFGYARLMAAIDRQRDRPLLSGLDAVTQLVREWSGNELRDDVSLLAIEIERIG
jgi:sigma-B regulation protein RsbU (phosphoserine phosphatase)